MQTLKRIAVAALVTGLFFAMLHMQETPKPDHIINWATAACGCFTLILALTWDN